MRGRGANNNFCLNYYAYRKMITVKMVFVGFFRGAKDKFGLPDLPWLRNKLNNNYIQHTWSHSVSWCMSG